MKLTARATGLVALLCLAAANVPQDAGTTLTVTRKTTKLRAQHKMFAPTVVELHEGDKVTFAQRDGAWLSVAAGERKGWLHETDVSGNPDVRLSGEGVRETYSASETSAARKGFNPQVERQYRTSNPNLEAAFKLVDRLQARATPEAEVRAFLQAGGLLKEGR
ncbi:MAG: hypothetical protein H6838_13210 [Planctomycetes bacterium]|nr:hypothetical protein [Planctomycetota bacterium]